MGSKRKVKRPHVRPYVDKKKKIIETLAEYGIDKKAIGPLLLAVFIEIILKETGIAHELEEHHDERKERFESIRAALKSKHVLDKTEAAVTKETLDEALRATVYSSWSTYF